MSGALSGIEVCSYMNIKFSASIDNNWRYLNYLLTTYYYVHFRNLTTNPMELHVNTFSNVLYKTNNGSARIDKRCFITVHCWYQMKYL
jgi:hypothetical protein